MFLFLSIYIFSVLGFIIHLYYTPTSEKTRARVVELMLLYQIVFSLGLTSLMAFFGLTFLDEYVAQLTNWPPSPFIQQLANVNLGYGILGILAIWYRKSFWIATVIGFSVWIISDGIQHLYHAAFRNNLSPGNVGVPLYTDFIIPAILLFLLFLYIKTNDIKT